MKYSRQREDILSFLKTRKDHPTAEVIYQHIREKDPRISLGTVYRNLSRLSDNGTILRLQVGDGMSHFDYDSSPHNHFVCRACNAVIDLDMPPIDQINKVASTNFDGLIEGNITYFYGLCSNCIE